MLMALIAYLTPGYRIFLEQFLIVQSEKFPVLTEHEGSSPKSRKAGTRPYPEPLKFMTNVFLNLTSPLKFPVYMSSINS
jgi:hypothetical protein